MSSRKCTTAQPDRWTTPVICIVFGVAFLVIGLANDQTGSGISGLVIMLAYGAWLMFFRGRAEPAALLAGDVSDERRVSIQQRASAATERVLLVVIVGGLFWSLATDNRYVGVFTTLSAIGGFTLFASTIWYSRRG